tara:strand:- start:1787 stop:2521 length:735 start_codon:yes stop_codon:yes gene_type:complete
MSQLINGDCLEEMNNISDNSVDIIIADLPYGRFNHLEWDKPIDLEKMWEELWRISKPNTPIFLFGDMLFGIDLINSQRKHFKYEIVWNKGRSTTPFLSRKRLGKAVEYVFVFYKSQPVYNYEKYHKKKDYPNANDVWGGVVGRKKDEATTKQNHIRYTPPLPINIIDFPSKKLNKIIKHITEKPQGILEFLLKYFSNEGDTCLDFCMGSGSLGVACSTLNRNFIGIELNTEHFELAKERLESSI